MVVHFTLGRLERDICSINTAALLALNYWIFCCNIGAKVDPPLHPNLLTHAPHFPKFHDKSVNQVVSNWYKCWKDALLCRRWQKFMVIRFTFVPYKVWFAPWDLPHPSAGFRGKSSLVLHFTMVIMASIFICIPTKQSRQWECPFLKYLVQKGSSFELISDFRWSDSMNGKLKVIINWGFHLEGKCW